MVERCDTPRREDPQWMRYDIFRSHTVIKLALSLPVITFFILQHSLKERIERNSEMLEKLLKFVDKKTERRWWLRDVINFAQVCFKYICIEITELDHQE